MANKLKIWESYLSWQEAETAWDTQAKKAASSHPLKTLTHLPQMPGITPETARHLKWKSFKYLIRHDKKWVFPRYFIKHPLKYGYNLLKSYFQKKSYYRQGDFFLYNCSLKEFQKEVSDPETLLVIGFSYCHKPFECPSGRFTDGCIHDSSHLVCQQCFIGKTVHALPENNVIPLFIPTIHYIGEKIFEIVEANPKKTILFLITACELTLKMFGDFGNMVGVKGIGVRLGGRICNTMKAFELSEKGVKPGLTVISEETQRQILELIKLKRLLTVS